MDKITIVWAKGNIVSHRGPTLFDSTLSPYIFGSNSISVKDRWFKVCFKTIHVGSSHQHCKVSLHFDDTFACTSVVHIKKQALVNRMRALGSIFSL